MNNRKIIDFQDFLPSFLQSSVLHSEAPEHHASVAETLTEQEDKTVASQHLSKTSSSHVLNGLKPYEENISGSDEPADLPVVSIQRRINRC